MLPIADISKFSVIPNYLQHAQLTVCTVLKIKFPLTLLIFYGQYLLLTTG